MDLALQPRTSLGRQFVAIAEGHAPDAWEHAGERDRAGRFPHDAFAAMKESGLLSAPVPAELGGMGLSSPFDLAVGLERLARGDGCLAIAANMHLTFALIAARMWRGAREAGDEDTAAGIGALLGLLGAGSIGMANATEPGTDLRHPLTEATKVEGGWSITGTKIFGTLCEIADVFFVTVRLRAPKGDESAAALVFRGTPGQDIRSDWDALGMRASGSHSVRYDGCVIEESQLIPAGTPWGEESVGSLVNATVAQLGLYSSFHGIAERAAELVREEVRTRTKQPHGHPMAESSGIQRLSGEIDVLLETSRAVLERVGRRLDEVWALPVAEVDVALLSEVARQVQVAKLVTNRAAIDVVDRALTMSGGSGYMTRHPLSRLYRDVRAGPFMQPVSPVDAHEYIGRLSLGLAPHPD